MTTSFGVEGTADMDLVAQAEIWLGREVGCAFGRREFARGRYMVALAASPDEFAAANRRFHELVRVGEVSSCLYIYRRWREAQRLPDVASVTGLLRCRMLGRMSDGVNPDRVSQTLEVECPVTGTEVAFNDFDLVGFYPQALNEADPLYDPSNHAPFACINQASDLFGFSLYVRDMMRRLDRGGSWTELDCAQIIAAIRKTVPAWNGMAERTISHFGGRTNPERLCPARLSADRLYYVTPHDESDFAEAAKRRHISEMPVMYLERMIDEWLRYFEEGARPRFGHIIRPAICPEMIDTPPPSALQ